MHFWQNDWGLLRATAVTQGWNGHQISSAQKVWRRKFSRRSCGVLNSQRFDQESGALTNKLSMLPVPSVLMPAVAWRDRVNQVDLSHSHATKDVKLFSFFFSFATDYHYQILNSELRMDLSPPPPLSLSLCWLWYCRQKLKTHLLRTRSSNVRPL